MHFTGTIWRPPFEGRSLLLQVTTGCTHNSCKFCSLYEGLSFRMSPMEEIEEDLAELKHTPHCAKRIFLTGANPFVLSFDKLKALTLKIKEYLPKIETIGAFARITDIQNKSVEQLKELATLGWQNIGIGTETGDDITLSYMNKGCTSADILTQCKKLEEAGIEYYIVYMTGLAGKGNGQRNALASAKVFNQLHPTIININALTVFPETQLYTEIQSGEYTETPEVERLHELQTLIQNLNNESIILGNTSSNTVILTGELPKDKAKMLKTIEHTMDTINETELRQYRESINHL
ncbi:MAG: radical SAM protein [Lachnospiraceae bacterium]